jgi:hypothetical protein
MTENADVREDEYVHGRCVGQPEECPDCAEKDKRIEELEKHLNVLLSHNPEPCDVCYEDRCGGALACDCRCHTDAEKMREEAIAALKGGEAE